MLGLNPQIPPGTRAVRQENADRNHGGRAARHSHHPGQFGTPAACRADSAISGTSWRRGFTQLDGDADYLLIDTAAGISSNVLHFLLAAPEVVVVSAPEPTAIVDAYAVIKIILAEEPTKTIRILINSVSDEDESKRCISVRSTRWSGRFLNRQVIYLGHVERDAHVLKAIRSQVLVTQCLSDRSSQPVLSQARQIRWCCKARPPGSRRRLCGTSFSIIGSIEVFSNANMRFQS